MAKVRLDKVFSNLGILTRTECKKAVKLGEISVNGEIAKAPDIKVDPDLDEIVFCGDIIDTKTTVYYMLNKPEGVITANDDPRHQTVFDLIDDTRVDLSAVGRLDKDTTGILLITNDGQLNHRLLSPKHHVPKTYQVWIDGVLTDDDIDRLTKGIDIGDDKPTLPAELEVIEDNLTPADLGTKEVFSPVLSHVALTITEGRYHQVKRMFEAVGKPVVKLHRSDFGPLTLDPELAPGEYRELTIKEIDTIKNF